jgi:hypothetical protein
MKLVRAHNPAETLLIVNPKRRGKMTRRKTAPNRRQRSTSNPRRRAAVSTHRRSAANLTASPRRRRRRSNPAPRRRNRRRNPQVKGLVVGALWAGAGAALTNVISGYIPIGGGGMMDVLKQGIAAYATGFIAERFTSPANAQLMAIGGFAGTAWSLVNQVLGGARGFATGLFPGLAPAGDGVSGYGDIVPHPGLYGFEGMGDVGDIVPAPDFYPQGTAGY